MIGAWVGVSVKRHVDNCYDVFFIKGLFLVCIAFLSLLWVVVIDVV